MRRFRRGFLFVFISSAVVVACGWDPSRPFERESPQVNEAIRWYDGGEAGIAADLLRDYLGTGRCEEGSIGTPDTIKEKSHGSFDLGLAFFEIAESYGHRFGDEENDAGFLDPTVKERRAENVECALKIVRKIAEDASQAPSLRARARYLEGNLLFLQKAYEEAVRAYDKSLELAPGMGDAGPISAVDASSTFGVDPVGRDAAWNRAVALRRIEDNKNKDGGSDGGGDGGESGDGGKQDDKGDGGGGGGNEDAGNDGGGSSDGDDGGAPPPKKDEQDAGPPSEPPPPSRQSQDERILDQLENAPTVQHEAAKRHGRMQRVKGMVDK